MSENVSNILFTFNSVFDIGLAYIMYIYDNYNDERYTKYFREEFFTSSINTIKNYVSIEPHKNPLYNIFNTEGEYSYNDEELDSLYDYLKNKQYKEVINYMAPNDIFKLCQTYRETSNQSGIKTNIICYTDEEINRIKAIVKDQPIKKIDKVEDIDMSIYSSIFVRDVDFINENYRTIKNLEGKTIYIENYRFNYRDEGYLNINEEVANANIIKTVEPYKDIVLAFGRKIKE